MGEYAAPATRNPYSCLTPTPTPTPYHTTVATIVSTAASMRSGQPSSRAGFNGDYFVTVINIDGVGVGTVVLALTMVVAALKRLG